MLIFGGAKNYKFIRNNSTTTPWKSSLPNQESNLTLGAKFRHCTFGGISIIVVDEICMYKYIYICAVHTCLYMFDLGSIGTTRIMNHITSYCNGTITHSWKRNQPVYISFLPFDPEQIKTKSALNYNIATLVYKSLYDSIYNVAAS